MPRLRDQRARGADQLRHRQNLGIPCTVGLQCLAGEDALRVTGHGDRRGARQIKPLARHGADGGHLGQQDAGAGDGGGDQLLGGGQGLFGGQSAHPLHGLEADRSHHDQFAGHRLEQQFGLADDLAQLRFDAGRADELLEVFQPGAALTAECDGVGLTGIQTIDEGGVACQRVGLLAGFGDAVGGHTALLIDRHVLLSPSVRLARCVSFVLWAGV